uniref:Uncharacterized protein n=1 Tax=Oryza sativa subsp. japonica TaxID=39947 RepID=Q338N9_ORYSJ|nr:hypothetical protein LOC_Os10g25120 [Oryza sativa Japonica Group]
MAVELGVIAVADASLGEVANVGTMSSINNNEDTSRRRRRRSTVKTKMPTNGGIIGQPCRRRHQSAATKASRSVKTWTPMNGGVTNQPYRQKHQLAAAKQANSEDVDAQQRRHRPAVQAETLVGGNRGGRW